MSAASAAGVAGARGPETPCKASSQSVHPVTPTSSTSTSMGISPLACCSAGSQSPSLAAEVVPSCGPVDLGVAEDGSVRRALGREFMDVLIERHEAEQEIAGIQADDARVYWQAFFVVSAFFCGYAALFGLQHFIKARFGIKDDNSQVSHAFGVATSCLYIFNLIFRFAHNVVFSCFRPRGRVLISVSFMMLSMLTIGVMIMLLESYHMGWVMLAYSFGGVAVGSFESNLLSCLTPLGHRTKHIAICGIPVGITFVLVGVFLIMGPPFNVPVTAIYFGVVCMNMVSLLLFVFCVPDKAANAGAQVKGQLGLQKFIEDCRYFRRWLPQLWHYPFAMTVDMFALSCFSPGVALFIYDKATVDVVPGRWVLPTDTFFSLYNTTNMFGGLLGRWLSYRVKPRHPACYTIFTMVGIFLLISRVPVLAPLSTFLIMVGDGLIYGTISRHVDANVPKEFNLTAISYWLFIGDFGSVAGSNMISYVRDWVVGG